MTAPNPPAFPRPAGQGATAYSASQPGMTLRDHFAGQAIGAVLATATGHAIKPSLIAQGCYAIADAMLEHRATEATGETRGVDLTRAELEAAHKAAQRGIDGQWRRAADFVTVIVEALGLRKGRG